jgi:hypothetical protein
MHQHDGAAGNGEWKFGQGIDPRPSAVTHVLLVLFFCCLSAVGHGALPERFFDPSDDAFDLSKHLLERSGFLPVPLIVTEPALGYGGGAAIVYFDEAMSSKNRARSAAQDAYELFVEIQPSAYRIYTPASSVLAWIGSTRGTSST